MHSSWPSCALPWLCQPPLPSVHAEFPLSSLVKFSGPWSLSGPRSLKSIFSGPGALQNKSDASVLLFASNLRVEMVKTLCNRPDPNIFWIFNIFRSYSASPSTRTFVFERTKNINPNMLTPLLSMNFVPARNLALETRLRYAIYRTNVM